MVVFMFQGFLIRLVYLDAYISIVLLASFYCFYKFKRIRHKPRQFLIRLT